MDLGRGEEGVGGRGLRWRVVEQAAVEAGPPALAPVPVDGSLQLAWGAQPLLVTLKRVQVLHIPAWTTREQILYSHIFTYALIYLHIPILEEDLI